MNLIIFGPQASGKGTQAVRIAKHFGIQHISTGDIFRENISKGTELGKIAAELINKGDFVPDEITNKIVEDRIKKEDCEKGFILDGYPRNKIQAEYLDSLPQKIDVVINLEVSEEEVIRRMSSRRVCVDCKDTYNILFLKPKEEGVCDKCGGKLVMRDDDKPEAIKKRLELYNEKTKPLLKFYEEKGILKIINGAQGIDEVFEDVKKNLS